MDLDEGLKYQTEIIKIEKMLQEIKELGIDTTTVETIINNIKNQLQKEKEIAKQKILNSENPSESIQNFFQENYYAPYYRKALQNLLTLEQSLVQNYDIYVRINGNLTYIENNIENVEIDKLPKLISLVKNILKDLKESTALDHEEEKRLIDRTYFLTYQLIKLELLFQEKSSLLDTILQNDIDIQNVEQILLTEINSLDPTQPTNQAILKKVKDLKPKGLMNIYLKESTYLDLDLLRLLAYVNNESFITKKKATLEETAQLLSQQTTSLTALERSKQGLEKELEDQIQIQNQSKKGIIKYGGRIAGMSSLILATFLTARVIDNKVSPQKNYYTKTTTYDVNKDKTTTAEDYQEEKENSIYLKKYFPYQAYPNSSTFKRDIFTYDISSLEYADMKDYATLNLEEFPFAPIVETQMKEEYELSPSDMYQEPYIIIEKNEVDFEKIVNKKNWGLSFLIYFTSLIPIFVEILIFGILTFDDSDSWLPMLKEALGDYHGEKIDTKILKQQLKELENTFYQQNQNLQQLKSRLEEEYQQLPSTLKENQEIIKIKKKIKEGES